MALSRWDDERDGWSYDDVFSPDPMGSSLDTDRVGSTRPDTTDPISTTPDLTGPTASADPWRDSVGGMYEKYLGRSAGEEDYAVSRTNPGGLAGIENTVKNSREAQGYNQVSAYQRAVQDLGTITDPTQRAVKRDQLARDIYNNLRSAGHDVKWNGDTLVVDGREYVIAGARNTMSAPSVGSNANDSSYAPRIVQRNGRTYLQEHGNIRELQPNEVESATIYVNDFWSRFPTGFQPGVGPQDNAGYQQTGWAFNSPTGGRQEFKYTPQSYGTDMTGFSGFSPMGEGSSDRSSIKNIFRDAAAGLGGGDGGFTEADLDETVARLNAMGIPAKKVDPYQIDFGTGEGPIQVRSSKNEVWWNNRATENAGGMYDATFGPSTGQQTAGVTGAGAGAGGVGTGTPGGAAPPPTPGPAPFTPSAPTYTPGEISMDDLEGLTYDRVMRDIGGDYVPPELGDFGPLGAGAVEDPLEASVLDLLRNPESLDPRTVETMKAKSKEEEVALWEQERDALDAFGARNNISDSNWLGSERQGARRDRDERLIRSNRDIDIRAAETNKEDRRKAISAGDAFATSKATRNQNEASFRRQTAQQNIDNQFKSREDKRQAIKLASDTQLAAAIERGDRLALREQINQKAVELGQSADRIMLDYTLGLIADATDRYGIDVGAQVDREKLAQAGREFQEELAFRIWSFSAQLAQDDSQFGANWRLNAGRLQLDADNAAWDRYRDIFGD